MPSSDPSRELRKTLSFWQVTVSGIGIVIGAGIYVLIGPATREAGPAVWLSFVVAATLAALTGLSYAELAGMYPSAGAEYSFARRAFNEFTGFLTGWLMVAANVIAAAAVSVGFAHYLRHFVSIDITIGAIALIIVLTAIIAAGIQRSIWLSAFLVVIQVGGLLLVIVAGAPHIGSHSFTEGATISGVWGAAALIFFAFIGFDEIVTLSEETRDASRAIPRALLLSLVISTVLYVLVAMAAVGVLGADAIGASDTPLTLVVEHDWGRRSGDIVALIALASTTNTSLLVLTAASRLLYGMSREGSLPAALQRLTAGRKAPYVAALAAGAVALGFALTADIELVASVTDFAVYVIFVVVNAALITLRFKAPNAARTFKVPLSVRGVPILPIAGSVAALLMMTQLRAEAWLIGAGALSVGLLVWALRRILSSGSAARAEL